MPMTAQAWVEALLEFARIKNVFTDRMRALAKYAAGFNDKDDEKAAILGRMILAELTINGHGHELVKIGLCRQLADPFYTGRNGEIEDDPLGIFNNA